MLSETSGQAVKERWDLCAYISIRRRRDALLQPLSRTLGKLKVSASLVSVFGVLLAGVSCWAVGNSAALALVAFLGALACDALDGALARHNATDSARGKVVDHACDTATFFLVLLAVSRSHPPAATHAKVSAMLAIPLLLLAIYARRRRSQTPLEPSGGFLAHVFKVPVYLAFLAFAAWGVDFLSIGVKLANSVAVASLAVLVTTMLTASRQDSTVASTTPGSRG